mgnify:CR=1 FL=1
MTGTTRNAVGRAIAVESMYGENVSAAFQPLEAGEPLGVVALSGPVDRALLEAGLEVIRGWDHPVIIADNVGRRSGYLAGSDEQRLAGVEQVVRSFQSVTRLRHSAPITSTVEASPVAMNWRPTLHE